jgi:hypothetical protein
VRVRSGRRFTWAGIARTLDVVGCVALATAVLTLALQTPASAQEEPITFSVIGDVPYTPTELEDLREHIDDHNRLSPSEFLVHLGDILGSGQACNELCYQQVADALRGLTVPAFVVPGDNEWNDCSDPDKAWAFWETHFEDLESSFCGAPLTERQAERHENFAFTSKGVLFVGINLVGGNPFDEAEWETRLQQDVDWVGGQLSQKGPLVRAAVIFAHAGPGQATHAPFFDAFGPLAGTFGKPVLYAMGDGHSWVIDKPFAQQNITRLQVDRGVEPPVQVTVGLDPLSPFTIVRNPWPGGTSPFNREPCVDVGPEISLDVGQVLDLDAFVTDDGVPDEGGNVTTIWSQIEGPARVTLADPSSTQTTASFPIPGQYVLQLAVHDGELLGLDTLSVDVTSSAPVLAIDDVLVDEGQTAQFTVRLLSGDGSPVGVDYTSFDGSAMAPGDYAAESGTVVFSGGMTEAVVGVPVHADGLIESTETFQLTLASPTGAILGKAEGVARVLDADSLGPPWVDTFSPTIGTVGIEVTVEGAGLTGASEVLVGGAPAEDFTVDTDRGLRAIVSGDAVTGPVVVTTPVGTDESLGSFAATLPTLEVAVSGSGTVFLEPPDGRYPLGATVSVTAIPAPGFDFAGWSGDLAGLPNPAEISMDGDRSAAAQFDPLPPETVSLDVAGQGPGSISFTPSGRLHPLGSLVTLSATPDPGAVFLGWGGDLVGVDSPTLLEMSASRSVTGSFSRSGLRVVRENYEKGSSSGLASVTTEEPVRDAAGDLYLAAVTTRLRADVVELTGLGLDWTELVEQCTRQGQSAVSLWWALGLPSDETHVTAMLSDVVANASIIVTRYSGVDAVEPFGPLPSLVSGNANGIDGACSGGIDTKVYALPLTTTDYESLVHAAIASTSRHYPGDDWSEIAEQRTGSGHRANLAVMEKEIPVPGVILVEGELADEMDWAMAAVELHPQQLVPVVVSDFSPAAGPAGTEVTLFGNALGGTTSVEFGGVPAQSVVVDTWAQVRAVVPPGATSGPIVVTTLLGSGASAQSFLLPACSDGLDNDGDGTKDFPSDLGCSDPQDESEHSTSFACDNGLDDDLDGFTDVDDPGCLLQVSPREDPECDDGLDNDGDGGIDWDGGPAGGEADASCRGRGWADHEDVPLCGLGFELVLLLPLRRRLLYGSSSRRSPQPSAGGCT